MALVVIFDEGASPQRVKSYNDSADTNKYIDRTDAVINPDLSLLRGIVPIRYWKHDNGAIVEYTQAEKDAQDAAEAQARDDSLRSTAKNEMRGQNSLALTLRAIVDSIALEINGLRSQHGAQARTKSWWYNEIDRRIDDGSVDE